MKLREYFDKYNVNMSAFARECGVAVSTVFYYYHEKRTPYQKTAEIIEKKTDGLVTVKELRGKDERETPGQGRKAKHSANID